MSWPCKLAVALQHFSASLPAPTPAVAAGSSNSCATDCTCQCKCCSGHVQKYVNFDPVACAAGGPVQKMVRFSTGDLMILLREAQSRANFWSNQYYKVDLQPDFLALSAAFGAEESVTNVAQLEQIMDTLTTGYRRTVAQLRGSEAHAALRPTAAAPIFPGLRCDCTECAQLPWCQLEHLAAHQWLHKPSDNWHCRLCHLRYFLQHTLLSHLSRRTKRNEVGPLLENVAYKRMLSAQRQQEEELALQRAQAAVQVEELHVCMPKGSYLDYVSESEVRVPLAPRKRCNLTECPRCSRSYPHSFSHQLHTRLRHIKLQCVRLWQCASCTRSFHTRRFYLQHLQQVRNACRLRLRKHKCSSCKWRFQLESSLRPHVAQAHVRSFNCLICQQTSPSRVCDRHSREEARAAISANMIKRRQELGRPPRPVRQTPWKVTCDECQKEFKNSHLLKVHIKRIHLNEKDFTCETCGRSFYSKKEITEHVRKVHLRVETIYCEPCGLTIMEKSNFSRHCDSIRHVEQVTNLAKLQGKLPADAPVKKHVPRAPMRYCESCDRHLRGHAAFRAHCLTKLHHRNLTKIQETLENSVEILD